MILPVALILLEPTVFFLSFFFIFSFAPETYVCGDHAAYYCSTFCSAPCTDYEGDVPVEFPINAPVPPPFFGPAPWKRHELESINRLQNKL